MARPEADAARKDSTEREQGWGVGGFRTGPASAREYQDTVVCLPASEAD